MNYYEGNDVIEFLVDPYMIAAQILLQTKKIQEATEYIRKAEFVIKQLNGDINEKMIEIYSIKISLYMMTEKL